MRRAMAAISVAGLALIAGCDRTTGAPGAEAERSGPWTLDAEDSGVTFVTTKLGEVAEIATFRTISGEVSEDGAARVVIDLSTVDTNNEIRDPRMREHLFETGDYPAAEARATIDLAAFDDIAVGARRAAAVELTIDLHGRQASYPVDMMVTRLGPNRVLVENKAPLILHAADFGMEGGVEKLRELASLDEITPIVPVTYSLVFER